MVKIRDRRNYASEHFSWWARLLHPTEAFQYCNAGGLLAIDEL